MTWWDAWHVYSSTKVGNVFIYGLPTIFGNFIESKWKQNINQRKLTSGIHDGRSLSFGDIPPKRQAAGNDLHWPRVVSVWLGMSRVARQRPITWPWVSVPCCPTQHVEVCLAASNSASWTSLIKSLVESEHRRVLPHRGEVDSPYKKYTCVWEQKGE